MGQRQAEDEAREYLVKQYCEHHANFYRAAYRILQDKYRAEDAIQEAFKKLLADIQKIRNVTPPERIYYITRVIINVAVDMYEREKKILYVPDIVETADLQQQTAINGGLAENDPIDILISKELAHRIKDTLDELSARDRNLILYRDEYDMSFSEVAAELGLKEPNTRGALSRARRRFCRRWEKGNNSEDK